MRGEKARAMTFRKYRALGGGEVAKVLFGELLGGFALAFGGDEVGGNAAGGAGAGGGRGEPEPGMRRRVLGNEFAIEEALLAERGGEEPEMALGGGDEGGDGGEDFVGNAGGFVDDEQVGGESAGMIGVGGQSQNEGVVGEAERAWIGAVSGERQLELAGEVAAARGEKVRLAESGREDQDILARLGHGLVEGPDGSEGRLAPLPVAIEEHVAGGGAEEFRLGLVGREV